MTSEDAEQITQHLNRTETSGRSRWMRVAPLVNRELRKMAAVALRQFIVVNWHPTLQPEELVSEFYIRLLQAKGRQWENRRHFFSYASTVMRSVLIDRHRASKVSKRPPSDKARALHKLSDYEDPAYHPPARTVEVGLALERLRQLSVRQANIIDLRFFAGMEIAEISTKLELSEKTVQRDWIAARAFLYAELTGLRTPEDAV